MKNVMYNLKRKYGFQIQSILSRLDKSNPIITMNLPIIVWAEKKGFVRIISATQQEWTQKGIDYFFSINAIFN